VSSEDMQLNSPKRPISQSAGHRSPSPKSQNNGSSSHHSQSSKNNPSSTHDKSKRLKSDESNGNGTSSSKVNITH